MSEYSVKFKKTISKDLQFLKPEIERIIHFIFDFMGISSCGIRRNIRIRVFSSKVRESYFDDDEDIMNINLEEVGWEGFNLKFGIYWQYLLLHEIGHFFEEYVAKDPKFIKLFGDVNKDYDEDKIYENLPKTFSDDYVSRYATKHPSEDWAETFATALIIRYFNERDELKRLKRKNCYRKIQYVYSIKDVIKRSNKKVR